MKPGARTGRQPCDRSRSHRSRKTFPASHRRRGVEGTLLAAESATLGARTVLRLWIRGAQGTKAYLDLDFEPYFFVLPEPGANATALAEAVRRTTVGGLVPGRVEIVERRWGREVTPALRVVTKHPGHVPPLREAIRNSAGVADVLEADVPYHHRYLFDKDLRVGDGIRFEVEDAGLPHPRLLNPVAFVADDPQPFRVLAFDVEAYNPHVVPESARDPIVLVALAADDGREELLRAEDGDDRALLETFVSRVREIDPDVLVTYNGDAFDWIYLVERAEKHGLKLAVGRDGSAPDRKNAGGLSVHEIAGRAHVDLYRAALRDLKERLKLFTLDTVAEELAVLPGDRALVPREAVAAYWDDAELRPLLEAYCRDDARIALAVARELLPLQVEFARRLRQPLGDASRMGRGRQVDALLLAEAHRQGVIAPNKHGTLEESFEGGYVMTPKEGLHENVAALDFSAMYPSIMIAYNVSPETLVLDVSGDVNVAPEVHHAFSKSPPGFFSSILKGLVDERRALKRSLAQASGAERERLDIRQTSLKILTNASYGYLGWAQARWFSREAAEATTAWGRGTIRAVMELARERGIEVLYGDTDSLFVRDAPGLEAFVNNVNARFPIELDLQTRYETLFFTGAKKRYAGLTRAGEIEARGLEVRRGDWCAFAKDVQEEVLGKILRDRNVAAAVDLVRGAVKRLKAGDVSVAELTIHKTLTQRPGAYKARQAHVAAIERAAAEVPGYKPTVGAKPGYVILKGDGPVHERAKLVEFLRIEDEIDYIYYVDKQVVPAAARILEHFGYDEGVLKGAPKQANLFEFA